jgi:hypothetical protein
VTGGSVVVVSTTSPVRAPAVRLAACCRLWMIACGSSSGGASGENCAEVLAASGGGRSALGRNSAVASRLNPSQSSGAYREPPLPVLRRSAMLASPPSVEQSRTICEVDEVARWSLRTTVVAAHHVPPRRGRGRLS